MHLPAKYMEFLVPAQGLLLVNGWRTHTILDGRRILLGAERDEENYQAMGWGLELDVAEFLTNDARLTHRRTWGFLNLDGFDELLRVAVMSPEEIAEFWGQRVDRIKDMTDSDGKPFNHYGELCPDPICGGTCRRAHHPIHQGKRTACVPHGCTHYQEEES